MTRRQTAPQPSPPPRNRRNRLRLRQNNPSERAATSALQTSAQKCYRGAFLSWPCYYCARYRTPMNFTPVLEFALLALTSVFFLVDPFTVIPLFLAITADSPDSDPR